MKLRKMVTVLFFTLISVSCAPAVQVDPTETVLPAPTITPILPTPALTPTAVFEELPDASDLSKWVDNYVLYYNGKVTINGLEVDVSQYPTAALVTNSNLASLPLGNCKQGIYLFKDQTYFTHDDIVTVEQWYRQQGWQDFIIKGHSLGLYKNTEQNLATINIGAMHRVFYSASNNLTKIHADMQVFICPER